MDLHREKKHRRAGGSTGAELVRLLSKKVELLDKALACRCGFSSNSPFQLG